MKVLAYIVLAMILYDWSIHLLFLFGKQDFFLERGINYWPEWKDKSISKKRYQQFWSTFWGIALAFLVIYLLNV